MLGRGHNFTSRDRVTNVKLHELIDRATWNITDEAEGDIAYFDGTNWVRLPKGTDDQVLKLVSGVPSWEDA